ncbi:MAG: HAD family phosphatase [Planctomycetota bacterium]|jgi:HAD superfamily hydrolase (TIGR01509 family)|nr:HAD family phosphatase [Planctomycetota bacterium]
MKKSGRPPAAVFDLDGVLVDSTPLHFRAWRRAAAERGRELDFGRFRATLGTGNGDTFRSVFGDGWSDRDIAAITGEKERFYRDELARGFVPVPGASELVAALAGAGWRLAVATSAPTENVRLALGLLPNGELLDARVDASMVARCKPDPEVFLRAAALLDSPPASCVVIEDGIAGLTGARRAGMATLALATTMSRGELLPFADRVRDNLLGEDGQTLGAVIAAARIRNRRSGGAA